MAVKTSNQHHIGPFKAQTGEGSALRLCIPTQIQLKLVKTVEIEPESAVPGRDCHLYEPVRGGGRLRLPGQPARRSRGIEGVGCARTGSGVSVGQF